MKIEFIYGNRWHKKVKGFGLGVNFEVYSNGFDVTFMVGPLYFGFELYRS